MKFITNLALATVMAAAICLTATTAKAADREMDKTDKKEMGKMETKEDPKKKDDEMKKMDHSKHMKKMGGKNPCAMNPCGAK